MSEQSAGPPTTPPGWYPDPSAPGSQRWWDGSAWTEHSAPAAPEAPMSPTGPTVLPDAAAYGAATGIPPAPAKRRGWVVPVVVVGVIVVALLAVGAFALVRWISNRSAVDLVATAPPSLLGLAITDNDQITAIAEQTEASMRSATSGLSDATSVAAAYGNGTDDLVIVGWVSTSSLLPPTTTEQMRQGILDGSGLSADPARAKSGPGPHGGQIDCVGGTVEQAQDLPIDACTWARDGTGVVFLVQYDKDPGETFADMSTAVDELLVVD